MKKLTLLFTVSLFCFIAKAQDIDFGKVSLEELQEIVYPQDSTASAVILYKNLKVYYDYTESEGFKLITQIHERIKIYNRDGLEWAEKTINTFQDNNLRETTNIKGYTYNLEDNKIVREKLKNSEIFKEKVDDNLTRTKFAMPNVKVGSIVEWDYTIISPFAGQIDDVVFQYHIPIKKIIVKIEIPQYFTFKYQPNFYFPIQVTVAKKNRTLQFSYRSANNINPTSAGSSSTTHTSTLDIFEQVYTATENNIPAIKDEPYINNIDNYIAKVHFEHISTQFPDSKPTFYSTDWESVVKTIYKSDYFGKQLEGTHFLKDDVNTQIADAKTDQEKAAILFGFIKTKIKWNGNYGKYTDKGIKKAYQDHEGNVADINLCLVAMFKEAGLKASPVLISTRSHGIFLFPTLDGFNYVIAAIEFPQGITLFDASEIYSTPNVLPSRALNWQGRLVRDDESSASINLFGVEPAKERTTLFIKMDENGAINGMKRSSFYTNYALNYRKSKAFLPDNDLQTLLEKENRNIEITDLKVSNKEDLSSPVVETFKFESDNLCDVIDDKIYFSPLFVLANSKNPFTLENRLYPIDYGMAWEDNYIVSVQIPDGYAVTTLPQNLAIGLPDNLGIFKFVISQKGDNKLEILTTTQINTSIIAPLYYQELKDFYKHLIEKQTEKVVLTKL